MKKIISLLVIVFISHFNLTAQNVKDNYKTYETKFEAFASKTGSIIRIVDYKLMNLKLYLGEVAETRIRNISTGAETRYFYQITKSTKYDDKTASIEYLDLIELIKALEVLKMQEQTDLQEKSDYLENKFVTEDGLQLGYFINEGISKWYMKLEKYGNDNVIFIDNVTIIENALNEGKKKIESIKLK